jgi:hypothetical protein
VSLNRTTVRALAASVAMFTAGGTVAAAAVFHLPVLGFDAAAVRAPTAQVERVASVHTQPVAPIRVVKTRVVNEIVHHHAVAASMPAPIASAAVRVAAPGSVSSTSPTTAPPPSMAPPTAPMSGGNDGHDAGDTTETEHDGHGDEPGRDAVSSPGSGQPGGGTQVDQ